MIKRLFILHLAFLVLISPTFAGNGNATTNSAPKTPTVERYQAAVSSVRRKRCGALLRLAVYALPFAIPATLGGIHYARQYHQKRAADLAVAELQRVLRAHEQKIDAFRHELEHLPGVQIANRIIDVVLSGDPDLKAYLLEKAQERPHYFQNLILVAGIKNTSAEMRTKLDRVMDLIHYSAAKRLAVHIALSPLDQTLRKDFNAYSDTFLLSPSSENNITRPKSPKETPYLYFDRTIQLDPSASTLALVKAVVGKTDAQILSMNKQIPNISFKGRIIQLSSETYGSILLLDDQGKTSRIILFPREEEIEETRYRHYYELLNLLDTSGFSKELAPQRNTHLDLEQQIRPRLKGIDLTFSSLTLDQLDKWSNDPNAILITPFQLDHPEYEDLLLQLAALPGIQWIQLDMSAEMQSAFQTYKTSAPESDAFKKAEAELKLLDTVWVADKTKDHPFALPLARLARQHNIQILSTRRDLHYAEAFRRKSGAMDSLSEAVENHLVATSAPPTGRGIVFVPVQMTQGLLHTGIDSALKDVFPNRMIFTLHPYFRVQSSSDEDDEGGITIDIPLKLKSSGSNEP